MKSVVSVLAAAVMLYAPLAFGDDRSADANTTANSVLAKYGDRTITFKEFAERQPNLTSWVGISAGAEQIEAGLDDVIFDELLTTEAERSDIANDPEVKAQVRKVLKTAYLKQRVPKESIEVTDAEIQSYYKKNQDKFKMQELVKVAHILLEDQEQAKKVRKEAHGEGNWKQLAEKYSIDPMTAKRGGSFGAIPPNDLLPELRGELENLRVGQVSQPIKSAFGYHLLKLEGKPTTTYRPLDEVKNDIYSEIFKTKQRDLIKRVHSELWKKYDVTMNRDAIDSVIKERTAANVSVDKSSLERRLRRVGEATELEVISETLDLGVVADKQIKEMMLVTNTTDRDMTITRVGSTCPCIQVSAEATTVPPGGKVKLALAYDPNVLRDNGQVQKTLYIESNDSIQPRKFVRLNLTVARKK